MVLVYQRVFVGRLGVKICNHWTDACDQLVSSLEGHSRRLVRNLMK